MKPRAPSITRRWKRWMAVGCTHGHLIDWQSAKEVLAFKERWKPDRVFHLGDFMDTAAFMRSARGSANESEPIPPDMDAGLDFLHRLEPTDVLLGNHDWRLWEYLDHPNAVYSYAGGKIIHGIKQTCEQLKAELVEAYDIKTAWVKLGDTLFGHGFMFNENSIRDHSEAVGKCVIAHLHRVGQERARRRDGATGYCVGYLGDETKFGYAHRNRAFTKWTHGFAWGEYCDTETVVRLEQRTDKGEWRMPL